MQLCGRHTEKLNQYMGLLIEKIIEDVIKPNYGMDIQTVIKAYLFQNERPALMFSLRKKEMVKNIRLDWEE